ncbi:MAG: glycosyltransferase [Microbacterium sp.]
MAHVLQSVVFPLDRDPDLLPLYVDPETWSTIDEEPVRVSQIAHLADVRGRTTARIPAETRVSFATYFNAFPASYWQHWTSVRRVRLTVRTEGEVTIVVYRSTGGAAQQRIDTKDATGTAATSFDLDLVHFSDGGWIWFDIIASTQDALITGGVWETEQEPARTGRASIGITTLDKPDYCTETLRALADAPEALALIDRIFVVDQGTDKVAAHPSFDEVAARLGETLRVIDQPNLGGSGGFARAMHETLGREQSDFVQLLDDDVRIEPESLFRSITFGRFTTEPVLVGAHMFDLLNRPTLHGWAEVIDEDPFMWRNLYQEEMPHDFRRSNLRQTPLLHMRMDADYNGWWMCLIPTEIIRTVGLALPAFIKWDDAEFCLRARDAGFATVSMPGVALWHVSWVGKDDSIDWQAYFHARNRIVAGLLHSSLPHGGRLIVHSRRADLKHLMQMQYYPATLRNMALRDVLRGPSHMRENLATALPAARSLAAQFPETTVHRDPNLKVRSRHGRQVFKLLHTNEYDNPTGWRLALFTAKTLAKHWMHRPDPRNIETPQVEFSKLDAHWWRTPSFDSVLVSAADGSGTNIYTRDRGLFRTLLVDSVRLHAQLRRRWPQLARDYRDALGELASDEAWAATFEAQA